MGRDIYMPEIPTGLKLSAFHEVQSSREVVNNQVYDVRKFTGKMQALTAGDFTISPNIRASVVVQQRRNRFSGDPFFNSIFGGVQTQPIDVNTEALNLHVKALPDQGRPANFKGAVGNYGFEMQAKPLQVSVGDPITVNMLITGEGNIEAITSPEYTENTDFKVYDDRMVGKDINQNLSVGRKAFEQVVIPKHASIKELPPLSFSFFDPHKGQYRTITRGPFPLTVTPSENGGAKMLNLSEGVFKGSSKILGRDIVYLKASPHAWNRDAHGAFFLRPWFLALQLCPIIAIVTIYFYTRRRNELLKDVAKARRQHAPRHAREGIRKATAALAHDNKTDFYEAIWQSLSDYFGNRLNLAAGEVSPASIHQAFKNSRLEQDYLDNIDMLFTRCEEARYAGSSSEENGFNSRERNESEVLLEKLAETLKACEKVRL